MDSDHLYTEDRPHTIYVNLEEFRTLSAERFPASHSRSDRKRGSSDDSVLVPIVNQSIAISLDVDSKKDFNSFQSPIDITDLIDLSLENEDPTRFAVKLKKKLASDRNGKRKRFQSNWTWVKLLELHVMDFHKLRSDILLINALPPRVGLMFGNYIRYKPPRLLLACQEPNATGSYRLTGTLTFSLSIIPNTPAPSAFLNKKVFSDLLHNILNEQEQKASAPEFYDTIFQNTLDKTKDKKDIVVPDLMCTLMQFQKDTVNWMLSREQDGSSEISVGWRDFRDLNGTIWFINRYYGEVRQEIRSNLHGQMAVSGGLLAEEMGLGKSVEIISLILSNTRPAEENFKMKQDEFLGRPITMARTTLIISPTSISKQWMKEFERHSPLLKVIFYHGRSRNNLSPEELADYDIVVTTYSVLRSEVHYALFDPNLRSLRNAPDKSMLLSPLVQIEFWRVCVDEVQMLGTDLANTTAVARTIPRVHAWGISGTPLKKEMDDLRSLLVFLRVEPFASQTTSWTRLLENPNDFATFFGNISIRHSHASVSHELVLPPQWRHKFTMDLNRVEHYNYSTLYQAMLTELGISETNFTSDITNANFVTKRLSNYLVRLRQACCHASVGNENRQALGGGALRTVDEILKAMIAQSKSQMLSEKRKQYISVLEVGRVYEAMNLPSRALLSWNSVVGDVEAIVKDLESSTDEDNDEQKTSLRSWRELLHRCYFFIASAHFQIHERLSSKLAEAGINLPVKQDAPSSPLRSKTKFKKVSVRKKKVSEAPHIEFTKAMANAQSDEIPPETNDDEKPTKNSMKDDVDNIDLSETDRINQLIESHSRWESEFYDKAEKLRRVLLAEQITRVQKAQEKLTDKQGKLNVAALEDATIDERKLHLGLESRSLIDKINTLGETLNSQAKLIEGWREALKDLVTIHLVDEDTDPHGEEYATSLDAQEFASSYIEVLQLVLNDRSDAVIGMLHEDSKTSSVPSKQARLLAVKRSKTAAQIGEKNKFLGKLMEAREDAKIILPSVGGVYNLSLRGLIAELRTTKQTFERNARNLEDNRYIAESAMLNELYFSANKLLQKQQSEIKDLNSELSLFRDLFNLRIAYYKSLQDLSDNVVRLNVSDDLEVLKTNYNKIQNEEVKSNTAEFNARKIKDRLKYLQSLELSYSEGSNKGERLCVICQHDIKIGSLTVCGHRFCKDCLQEWSGRHKTCPLCKRYLNRGDVFDFSFANPNEVELVADSDEPENKEKSIYSETGKNIITEISTFPTYHWFGTKIDWMIKHLRWLRSKDENAQVVVFSQWRAMLNVFAMALEKNGFQHASVNNRMSEFISDPSIACFLLDAKSESAGLTLVNAQHVYLSEPLVNTALELQAISRVHRIGQTEPTNVWLFTTSNTVEEAIIDLSTKRRMENIDQDGFENANSKEMKRVMDKLLDKQQGGEVVGQNDLRAVLFDKKTRANVGL